MSRRRAPATGGQQSPESDIDNDDVEMRDRADDPESDVDAEGEPDDGGSHDMFLTISDLSTYLCGVEEEYEFLRSYHSYARRIIFGC